MWCGRTSITTTLRPSPSPLPLPTWEKYKFRLPLAERHFIISMAVLVSGAAAVSPRKKNCKKEKRNWRAKVMRFGESLGGGKGSIYLFFLVKTFLPLPIKTSEFVLQIKKALK